MKLGLACSALGQSLEHKTWECSQAGRMENVKIEK